MSDELYDRDELAVIDGWSPPSTDRAPDVGGLRRATASGAVAAAVLLGLRDVFEDPGSDVAPIVVEAEGEPEDRAAPVVVRFDADDPSATTAELRHPAR